MEQNLKFGIFNITTINGVITLNIKVRQWNSKVQAMPRIPRSQNSRGYVTSLIKILKAIESGKENNHIMDFEGSKSSNTLNHYCIRLRPIGIVEQKNSKWYISEELIGWNDKNIGEIIPELLNAKVKYISEMLKFIQSPKKIKSVLEDAKKTYNMTWKDNSQVYDRLHWFMDLGMVKHISYEQSYVLTESGKAFLKKYPPVDSSEILRFTYDQTEEENEIIIPNYLEDTYQYEWSSYKERKNNIGYVPGGVENIANTISDTLDLSSNYADFNNIYNYLKSTYNISENSNGQFTTFLTHLNILERTGEKTYKTSQLGMELLQSENIDLNIVFILHKYYNYIFEMLFVIRDKNMTVKELATVGKTKFNMPTESIDQIRKRINYLKNAFLIIEDTGKTFRLTQRGRLLCDKLDHYYNNMIEENTNNVNNREKNLKNSDIYDLLYELRSSSIDSSNPTKFEKVLQRYFEELGFISELLAKSGTTDILLTAPTAPKFTYRVNIDAKTNKDGKVTEGLIDIETLKEHKEKHKANYVLVVGKSFIGSRLIKRAENNGIALIDVDTLEMLLKNHQKFPLQAVEYLPLFQQRGIVKLEVLDKQYNIMDRQKDLFKSIIKILTDNSNDDYSGGIISSDVIYFIIKQENKTVDTPITMEEVKDMLSLLSNPLIDCVGKTKDGYYAKGSLKDAALKFRFYYDVSTN
ncbi:restriction endonuclease [Staphylococcus shinii]|uniref:restriction endonuclease n=1 Tax=Staphylococcus shinii TaxID=2912228 RepID=UPI000E69D6D3|nr:restriction endonuclease [Staphylococcus shinii]MDW8563786.1 restriction endonuclease [Staphylococcus shinii]MDW8567026.1 restriction endonuclease [Staphylococcus shinii]RIN06116.1 hypothetical protein BU101_11705 [Staphylococcus shinii]